MDGGGWKREEEGEVGEVGEEDLGEKERREGKRSREATDGGKQDEGEGKRRW